MKDLNERIAEILNEEISFEKDVVGRTVMAEEDAENSKDDAKDSEGGSDADTTEEFHADDLIDFMAKTGTNLKMTKVASEPNPDFGERLSGKNHNKYKCTFTNKNGSIWFYFWDSIYNTENGIEPKDEDVIAALGLDASAVIDNVSYEEFVSEFGYEEADEIRARKAYDGCRKMVQRAKKMFSDAEINELIRLSSEY